MDDRKRKDMIDRIVKIILVIIIIILLLHNCSLMKKRGNNIDIIDINCDNNECRSKEIKSLSFADNMVSVSQDGTIKLIVIVNPSELSDSHLTWRSSDTSIVTVDKNGIVKGINVGRAIITVTSDNGKTASITVEVTKEAVEVKSIKLSPNKSSIDAGSTTQVRAVIEPLDATERDLIWTSSDTSVATVDSNGIVTGLKSGTVTITAKTKDGKVIGNTTITVKSKQIESLSFADKKVNVKQNDTLKLIVTVNPSELANSHLTWKSSNSTVATVSDSGIVKGVSVGKAVISVTSNNGKTASITVEVTKETVEVKSIKLTPNKNNIDIGSSTQINVVVEPANATGRDLVWTSSDASVATVDSNGIVTGLKSGTVTITVKTKDGKVTASTTITVNPKQIESLSFQQNNYGVKKGDTLSLNVIVNPSELANSPLTWESSDPTVATVTNNGIVRGINVGRAVITVTSANGKMAVCTVEVTSDKIEVEEIVLTPDEDTVIVGDNTNIMVEFKPNNATETELVWTSSDPTVATVDNNGRVSALKSGTVTITAKTKNGKVVARTTININHLEDISIFDDDHTTVTWNGASDLKIFSKTSYTMDGKIAPESSNTYKFVVKNSTNYKLKYKINFIENNDYNINMQYKLKKNDTYIFSNYVKPSELIVNNIVLNSGEIDTYYLEWKWISSNNDTSIGEGPEAKYGLKIEIEAEGTNG